FPKPIAGIKGAGAKITGAGRREFACSEWKTKDLSFLVWMPGWRPGCFSVKGGLRLVGGKEEGRGEGSSRRRCLTFTLRGTGAVLGSVALYPMVRFSADPSLKREEERASFVDVGPVDQFDETYKLVRFFVKRKDGWHHPEKGVERTAWVRRSATGEILALSPVCKHLN